jgi:hypothetical protein
VGYSNYLSTLYFIFSIKGIDHGTTLVHCVDAVSCKCVLICKEKLTRMGKWKFMPVIMCLPNIDLINGTWVLPELN